MAFLGFARDDGAGGARNYVAVVASVICSTTPVRTIGAAFSEAISIVHQYGCAQMGDDLTQTRRTLAGVAANPNVAAALVVGLGCENNQAPVLARSIPVNKPVEVIGIQELGGADQTVRAGIDAVRRLIDCTRRERSALPASRLTVGVLGVEPDPETRSKVYPAVGRSIDAFVAAGARVILGVGPGLAPAGRRLAARARDGETAGRLEEMGDGLQRRRWHMPRGGKLDVRPWTEAEAAAAQHELSITGTAPVETLVDYAERPAREGLALMAVPSDPVEAMTGLVAGGAAVIVAASSRGLLAGALGAPTLVVAPDRDGLDPFASFVDVAVGGDVDREAARLVERVYEVASGAETATERERLFGFAISQVGTPF